MSQSETNQSSDNQTGACTAGSAASASASLSAASAQSVEAPKCSICSSRAVLADALAELGKAVAEAHHLARHWRTAHEKREASNFDAEERTAETLAQFDADTAEEARWFALYEAALVRLTEANQAAAAAREDYHANLKAYTDTRVAS